MSEAARLAHIEAMKLYPDTDCGCEICETEREREALRRSMLAQARIIQDRAEQRLEEFGRRVGIHS